MIPEHHLDVSSFFKDVFGQYGKILMMSATILDKDAFYTSLGLAPEEVKFIQVPSDFSLHNRPIYPLNTAHLNSKHLQLQEVQIKIANRRFIYVCDCCLYGTLSHCYVVD